MPTPVAPHITYDEKYSPLSSLMSQAMKIYGDFAATDGETVMMLLQFANQVLEDVRMHPYGAAFADVPNYTHPQESRPVDDTIIRAGLLHYYALQQVSAKSSVFGSNYFNTLNRTLWRDLNGNTAIALRAVDATDYSTVNGQLLPDEE